MLEPTRFPLRGMTGDLQEIMKKIGCAPKVNVEKLNFLFRLPWRESFSMGLVQVIVLRTKYVILDLIDGVQVNAMDHDVAPAE